MIPALIAAACFLAAIVLGYWILAPLSCGFRPFTSPAQAARGERRLRP